MLENGADTQAQIKEGGGSWGPIAPGIHALDLAIQYGRTEEMELLLAGHADPNARYASSRYSPQYSGTPLLWVLHYTYNSRAEQLKLLLDHGADPDLTDQEGKTPLSRATGNRDLNSVQQLLDHHADPNKPDNQGLPPLAFVGDKVEIRAALLKAGANEDFQRQARIFIAQKGTGSIGQEIFGKGTNSINHFTLLKLWRRPARTATNPLNFQTTRTLSSIVSRPAAARRTSPSIWRKYFPPATPPKTCHWNGAMWCKSHNWTISSMKARGMPPDKDRDALIKCLQRHVQIVVKGQTTKLTLVPTIYKPQLFKPMSAYSFGVAGELLPGGGIAQEAPVEKPVEKTIETFSLNEVVHQANVLLLSSDLTRVKVTRNAQEMQYNLAPPPPENNNPNRPPGMAIPMPPPGIVRTHPAPPDSADLWLRDGDIIEIPERDPNVPAVK